MGGLKVGDLPPPPLYSLSGTTSNYVKLKKVLYKINENILLPRVINYRRDFLLFVI